MWCNKRVCVILDGEISCASAPRMDSESEEHCKARGLCLALAVLQPALDHSHTNNNTQQTTTERPKLTLKCTAGQKGRGGACGACGVCGVGGRVKSRQQIGMERAGEKWRVGGTSGLCCWGGWWVKDGVVHCMRRLGRQLPAG